MIKHKNGNVLSLKHDCFSSFININTEASNYNLQRLKDGPGKRGQDLASSPTRIENPRSAHPTTVSSQASLWASVFSSQKWGYWCFFERVVVKKIELLWIANSLSASSVPRMGLSASKDGMSLSDLCQKSPSIDKKWGLSEAECPLT